MDEATEKLLVESVLDGDSGAFASIVDAYQRPLFNVAYRMLNNREDASDAVQTTFLKAFEKIESYDARHRFFSWIYRILVNETINLLGKRRCTEPVPASLASTARSPEETCDEKLLADRVQSALQQLASEYRMVISLKYFGGMSYREMSDVLDIPEKTVKSRLFTARRRLSTILTRQGVRI